MTENEIQSFIDRGEFGTQVQVAQWGIIHEVLSRIWRIMNGGIAMPPHFPEEVVNSLDDNLKIIYFDLLRLYDILILEQGPPGQQGSIIFQGWLQPNAMFGRIGDWYIQTSTWDMWEKVDDVVWVIRLNLRGAQGIQGLQGLMGNQGIQGKQGIPGEMGPSGGITAPVATFFTMFVDDMGDLFVMFNDYDFITEENNPFEFNDATGELYYVIG